MSIHRARIAGVGSYVPERVVTNEDLTQWMDTSDEWIRQRSGIETRHWVEGATSTSDLALEASRGALADAGWEAGDLDMIILGTLSPDHDFPGTACYLQAKLGVPGIAAIDVRQQCTGFIYALSVADQFLRSGHCERILVVGAEVHSKSMDLSTEGRDISVLFGDGAGAVVLEACEVEDPRREAHILSTHLHADGDFADELCMKAPQTAVAGPRITHEMIDAKEHFPHMNGKLVFLHASKRMPESVLEACQANGVDVGEVDLFLFHQANLRINQQVAKQLGVDDSRVFNTVQRFGNTTAATIPLGMHEAIRAGVLRPGMLVALSAFGSGFTWASALLRL
jgi:3-oxoacyl-[acyl-carrier-protein] synthase-3